MYPTSYNKKNQIALNLNIKTQKGRLQHEIFSLNIFYEINQMDRNKV